MRDAEITCLTRMVAIPDLGLELCKGDVVVLAEEEVNNSQDLEMMRRLNAVRVRWVHRYNKMRAAPPPASHRPRPLPNTPRPNLQLVHPAQPSPAAVVPPPTEQEKTAGVDLEKLADKLAARLGGKLDRVLELVASRPAAAQGSSPAPAGTVDDEVPVFLPSRIVDHDAKADIKTTRTTGKADGIDEATAALKKARKKARKGKKES